MFKEKVYGGGGGDVSPREIVNFGNGFNSYMIKIIFKAMDPEETKKMRSSLIKDVEYCRSGAPPPTEQNSTFWTKIKSKNYAN